MLAWKILQMDVLVHYQCLPGPACGLDTLRITEWLRDLKDQPCAMAWLPPSRSDCHGPIQPGLQHLQGWAVTVFECSHAEHTERCSEVHLVGNGAAHISHLNKDLSVLRKDSARATWSFL